MRGVRESSVREKGNTVMRNIDTSRLDITIVASGEINMNDDDDIMFRKMVTKILASLESREMSENMIHVLR